MSKDKCIADIVKQLDSLSIDENQQILNYINNIKTSKVNTGNSKTFKDRDKKQLQVGDRVVLLTKGVDNIKGETARVHALPLTGKYIQLRVERTDFTIKKYSTSVRKIES